MDPVIKTFFFFLPAPSKPNVLGEGEGDVFQRLLHLPLLLLAAYAQQVPVEVSAIEEGVRPAQLLLHHHHVPTHHHRAERGRRDDQLWKNVME